MSLNFRMEKTPCKAVKKVLERAKNLEGYSQVIGNILTTNGESTLYVDLSLTLELELSSLSYL